jgi:hypothetical protein
MSRLRAGVILLLVQLALVLSVAGKYLYERTTRPRIWVRATQFDPETPLRGRYLAMQLLVDACGLPHDESHNVNAGRLMPFNRGNSAIAPPPAIHSSAKWSWHVRLHLANGTLVPELAEPLVNASEDSYEAWQTAAVPCNRGVVRNELNLFIPEHAKTPFPLKPGQELWVEVTVPRQGPPRPIQLALSDTSGFRPLKFN